MDRKYLPLLVALGFWIAGFLFVVGAYSSEGLSQVTGFAVSENSNPMGGTYGVAILVLFFSNIVTLFFLIRSVSGK